MYFDVIPTTQLVLTILISFHRSNANLAEYVKHPNYHLFPQAPECGVSSLADTNVASRIIGGSDARLGEFPWMAYTIVFFDSESEHSNSVCGGAIINKRYILTAAHCYRTKKNGYPRTGAVVVVGDWDKSTDPDSQWGVKAPPHVIVQVEEVIVHPGFVETHTPPSPYDIALFRLKNIISFNDFVKPICLPFDFEETQDKYVGSKVVEAGWGLFKNGSESAQVLQKLVTTIADQKICQQEFKDVGDSQMCVVATPFTRSCAGDSGSPLMYTKNTQGLPVHYILGVHSFGTYTCSLYYNGTKISGKTWIPSFIKWILDNVRL